MKIGVGKCKVRGVSRWRVRWRELGRVRRKFFGGRATAEAFAASLRGEALNSRQRFAAMPPDDQARLMSVWKAAHDRGVDLYAALTAARPATGDSPALEDVIAEMVRVKRLAGLSERYLTVLELLLKGFSKGRERLPVAMVSLDDVERFLEGVSGPSRATLRGRVSTLLRFAVRRGYRLDNPCERLERMKWPRSSPAVLSVKQVRKALKWFEGNPRSLGWFVLSTFAGLRPEEADQTRWADIHFAEGWIRVEAQTSKVRQRRIVYPLPMVFDWLRRAKRRGAVLPIGRFVRMNDLRGLRKPLKLARWPKDVTRHTAASMWLAHCGSAATVATALGHSELVLRKHYMALVTQKEAARFWGLKCGA